MSTLLHMDSSALGGNASFSRQLSAEFARQWKKKNPDGAIITRDLATTVLPPVTAEWIRDARNTPEDSLTAQQRATLSLSNELVAELHAADEYVFGIPMYNFSIPAVLKLWIDQVVRYGKTFTYENHTPMGLLKRKVATFIVASGGVYDEGSPSAAMNFVDPYLKSLFGFLGVTDAAFIHAGGTMQVLYGVDRETILRPPIATIQAQFQAA